MSVQDVSFAILPLLDRDQTPGVLGLGWQRRQVFDAPQVDRLTEVAELAAAALWRAQANGRNP